MKMVFSEKRHAEKRYSGRFAMCRNRAENSAVTVQSDFAALLVLFMHQNSSTRSFRIWAQWARAGDPLFFSDASPAVGRVGGGRRPAAHAAAGRHRCEAASVGYAHAPGGEATMAGRGAWKLDGGARRVETMAPSNAQTASNAI